MAWCFLGNFFLSISNLILDVEGVGSSDGRHPEQSGPVSFRGTTCHQDSTLKTSEKENNPREAEDDGLETMNDHSLATSSTDGLEKCHGLDAVIPDALLRQRILPCFNNCRKENSLGGIVPTELAALSRTCRGLHELGVQEGRKRANASLRALLSELGIPI